MPIIVSGRKTQRGGCRVVFNVLFWIVWLLIGLLLAALFSAIVLPRLLLEMKASLHPIADRGIGKFNLKNGISVLYEPSRSERKYLRCYQLFRRGDRSVSFMGCWNRAVFTARYTLLCFNSLGRPIAFYRVCESFIDGRYYTRTVTLPHATAFVSLSLERIDGKKLKRAFSPSPFYLIWLTLFLVSLAGLIGCLFFLAVHFSEGAFQTASALPIGSILTALSFGIVFLPLAVVGARMLILLIKDRPPFQSDLCAKPVFRRAKEKMQDLISPVRAMFGGAYDLCRKAIYRCMNAWSLVKQTFGRVPRGSKKVRRGTR